MEVDRGKDGEANKHDDEKPAWLYILLLQLTGHYPNFARSPSTQIPPQPKKLIVHKCNASNTDTRYSVRPHGFAMGVAKKMTSFMLLHRTDISDGRAVNGWHLGIRSTPAAFP
jgi:hypothetical protein